MKGQTFPRINCSIPGCERGSTKFPPGNEVICGHHWQSVPQTWRRRFALYKRRFNAARLKGDQRGMQVAGRCLHSRWSRMVELLTHPESLMHDGLPVTVSEKLRKEGLL